MRAAMLRRQITPIYATPFTLADIDAYADITRYAAAAFAADIDATAALLQLIYYDSHAAYDYLRLYCRDFATPLSIRH